MFLNFNKYIMSQISTLCGNTLDRLREERDGGAESDSSAFRHL